LFLADCSISPLIKEVFDAPVTTQINIQASKASFREVFLCVKYYMKKKLGVIGGLGTDTAAQFYVESERLWHASGQKSHIPFMLENSQSAFSLEQSLTCSMDRVDELRNFLCDAAKNLEKGGSTILALPCNTAHVHIDAVRNFVTVPVLSITEEVANKLSRHHVKRVAILCTTVTRVSGIYDNDCSVMGIQTIYPSRSDQLIIETIIQRALSWENDDSDHKMLQMVIDRVIRAGADAAVLACTDLQLCMPKQLPANVIDSMKTLSEASVQRLLQA
jgi:aspartate racemase